MLRYGAGRELTTNILFRGGLISTEQELLIKERVKNKLPHDHGDVIEHDEIGLDRGPLLKLVQRALDQGAIRSAQARRLLDLRITDPIPSDGYEPTPAWAAPMITEEAHRLRQARAALFIHTGSSEYIITTIHPGHEGWTVEATLADHTHTFTLSPDLTRVLRGPA